MTSALGFFEITDISFSPKVIAFGETSTCSLTIKNISGKKIPNMYMTVRGSYTTTDSVITTADFSSGTLYLHGGPSYAKAAVNWASGASLTYTFDYTFGKRTGYDVDTYVLSKTMILSIVTDTTFDTGNYDNFYDITEGNLDILSERDNPRLSFSVERCTKGVPDDEGESLLCDAALTCDSDSSVFLTHSYTASASCSPEHDLTLDASIADLLSGITDSTDMITDTFSNGSNFAITLLVTNGYESVSATVSVSRAFANVHMSGKTTGGVCFGGFSSAEEDKPKFECYYPAYFYGGIEEGGGSGGSDIVEGETEIGTFLGKPLYRYVYAIPSQSGAKTYSLDGIDGTISYVVHLYGTVTLTIDSALWAIPLNTYYSSSIRAYARVKPSTNEAIVYTGGSSTGGYLILEYTKE